MYDAQLAYYLAVLCDKSYKESSFEVNNIQVKVLADEARTVIVFRGTEAYDLRDIQTDISIKMKDGMHEGFLKAWKAIEPKLLSYLAEINVGKDVPMYFTGHSMGGALAALAAVHLNGKGFDLRAVYTYGAPRVSSAKLDSLLPCPVYRIVNAHDLVPRVPLMLMKYRHIGELHYITKSGRMIINPSLLDTEPGFFSALIFKWKTTIQDHSLVEYLKKLQALV